MTNFKKNYTLRDKTMANKLMYILNDDAQNYLFCRLLLVVEKLGQLYKPTNQIQSKVLKVVKRIRKLYYKTLGTSTINSQMSPPSLCCCAF